MAPILCPSHGTLFRAAPYQTLIAVLCCLGCGTSGPPTFPVSGTVTWNGEAIPDGYITFLPENPSSAPDAGKIVAGKYALKIQAGPKRVEIQASKFVGPENPIMGLRPREQYIPERYNFASTLTADVTPDGDNRFDFALQAIE